jgi:hypothetical protein
LFITVPTKDRPQLLSRALASVAKAVSPEGDRIVLTVSVGSADEASGRAVDQFPLPGLVGTAMFRNRPPSAWSTI